MKTFPTPVFPADAKVTAAENAIAAIDSEYKSADSALTTRVDTAEKAITDNKTAADTAIASVTTAYKAADTALDTAFKAADKAITDAAAALTTRVTTAESAITANKTNADNAIASAIADWVTGRAYKKDNIVMRNKTFFLCLFDNSSRDPLTDNSGAWGIFTPGSASDIYANRSPTGTDVQPIGVKFWDTSFGSDTPLGFVSRGGGSWVAINAITLRAIRVYVRSHNASYPLCSQIRFINGNDAVIPYSRWIVGARSASFSAPAQGSIYTGGGATPPNRTTGWVEFEPSANFDYSQGIKAGRANLRSDAQVTSVDKMEFYFTSGAMKSFTATNPTYGGDGQFIALPSTEAMQYGSNIDSAQGPILTASQLADANDATFGRISGQSLNGAISQMALAANQTLIQGLSDRIAALEAAQTPPA